MNLHIKNIALAILALVALSACQVGFVPEGVKEQKPLQNFQEVVWLRDAMYTSVRVAESPANLFLGDAQADLYHLTASDNGANSPFFEWNRSQLIDNDRIAGYFGAFATIIKDANYFIMRIDELKADTVKYNKLKPEEQDKIKEYVAEARTLRALANYRLMCRFSKRYDANANLPGIILVKEYDPLLQKIAKKRATQKEVYDYCISELEAAAEDLPERDEVELKDANEIPYYIHRDYAFAVMARIYLEMHEYDKAIEAVDEFIDKPEYELSDGTMASFKKIWVDESSSEIMVKTFANKQVGGVRGILHGLFFYSGDQYDEEKKKVETVVQEYVTPTWYPNQYLLDLYGPKDYVAAAGAAKDLRMQIDKDHQTMEGSWFEEPWHYSPNKGRDLSSNSDKPIDVVVVYPKKRKNPVGTSVIGKYLTMTFVSKFRGNPALNRNEAKNQFSYAHTTHLFDIAEAYLIKAEAQAWKGDVAGAKKTIEKLRKSRGLTDQLINADTQEAMKQIVMDERTREMIGMGTRMTDLKRWNMPMSRKGKGIQTLLLSDPYGPREIYVHDKTEFMDLEVSPDNPEFIWELPVQDRNTLPDLEENWPDPDKKK